MKRTSPNTANLATNRRIPAKMWFDHPAVKFQEPTIRRLVRELDHNVDQALQLFGDFPQLTRGGACEHDWMHVLLMRLADIGEQARFDLSDPEVNRAMLRELANLVATAEAWAQELEGV